MRGRFLTCVDRDVRRQPRSCLPALMGVVALAGTIAGSPARADNPCSQCHEEQVKMVQAGPHTGAAAQGPAFCESCHGESSKHLQTGAASDIVGKEAIAAQGPRARSQACLSCHASRWPAWADSEHGRSGDVSCWSCHREVAHFADSKPLAFRGEGACGSCHQTERGEFRRVYHHPVPEGRMGCVSCHEVHGSARPDATETGASRCTTCHPEVAGPYVFPHRAMEEGCSVCHTPHGSVNRTLLNTSGNGSCLNCHLQSNFPAVGNAPHNLYLAGGGKCLDCHSEVHGSNVDEMMAPRFRRQEVAR